MIIKIGYICSLELNKHGAMYTDTLLEWSVKYLSKNLKPPGMITMQKTKVQWMHEEEWRYGSTHA